MREDLILASPNVQAPGEGELVSVEGEEGGQVGCPGGQEGLSSILLQSTVRWWSSIDCCGCCCLTMVDVDAGASEGCCSKMVDRADVLGFADSGALLSSHDQHMLVEFVVLG